MDKYESNEKWLEYFREKYTKEHTDTSTGERYWTGIFSRDNILSTFTDIRQQTAIDDEKGIADEHSLRTIRVIKKGLLFKGEIEVETDDSAISNTLALACLNLRRIGTKRNRGFGEVECKLFDGTNEVSVLNLLEAICRD
jgi:CRISPR-associated protein Csx10